MKRNDTTNASRPLRERVQLALILSVFAAAFGSVAIIFGAVPMVDAVSTVWRANSLIEVPATVLEVRLDRYSGRTKEHLVSLVARYRYDWKGETFESSRISVQHWDGWHDSATWHREWFDKLEHARKSQTTVSAWVDADDPLETVLDKEMRWGRPLLALPFLILFSAVSLFSAVQIVRVLFGIDWKRTHTLGVWRKKRPNRSS
jgi:Protein of unknown function (DUF3592)